MALGTAQGEELEAPSCSLAAFTKISLNNQPAFIAASLGKAPAVPSSVMHKGLGSRVRVGGMWGGRALEHSFGPS